MRIKDFIKHIIVVLLRIKPKIFSSEEKKEMKHKLIENNHKENNDVLSCSKELIKDLNIEKYELSNCVAWFLSKENNPKNKIIYYIHGGGFINSNTKKRMKFISYIVNNFNYNVFSIDYRLAPEYMFPLALEDCLEGYKVLLGKYNNEDIVFVGESAGGNLVLSLSLLIKDNKLLQPSAIYSNSPVTQLVEYTDSYHKYSLKRDFVVTQGIIENTEGIYFDFKDRYNPNISPLYGDLKDLAPIYLSVSNCESLLDDSLMMYEKLIKAGNKTKLLRYDDLCHAFIISPQIKDVVKKAYPDFKEFLDKYLK